MGSEIAPVPGARRLAETVADASLRQHFYGLVELLGNLHDEVQLDVGPVEVFARFSGETLCRIVAYRDVLHLQIGESPVWEVRVRDDSAYNAAVDRLVERFLSLSAAVPPQAAHGARVAGVRPIRYRWS